MPLSTTRHTLGFSSSAVRRGIIQDRMSLAAVPVITTGHIHVFLGGVGILAKSQISSKVTPQWWKSEGLRPKVIGKQASNCCPCGGEGKPWVLRIMLHIFPIIFIGDT